MESRVKPVALFAASLAALSGVHDANAGPAPTVHPALYDAIAGMPEGTWKQMSVNTFKSVWTPASQRPLFNPVSGSNPTPHKIIAAWSGYGWDTRRGDLIIYGGGHGNYSGNDVYRWRSSTLKWERIALPTEVVRIPVNDASWESVDGPDNSPNSAHTYDNHLYLPIVDRFLTFGGANFNTGGPYLHEKENQPGTYRVTGPYFFDPSRGDGDKVGGQTGSHVQRVFPYPEVVGGQMWENRDIHKHLAGSTLPRNHINGCTAYTEEGGRDVVYLSGGSDRHLYRYMVGDVANPASDRIAKVGHAYYSPSGQLTCALDAASGLFVKTGPHTKPFVFWDMATAGATNRDKPVAFNDSINTFVNWLNANNLKLAKCAIDHDPRRGEFLLWCGGGSVWSLRPPLGKGVTGWAMQRLVSGGATPSLAVQTGILGKWRYIPGYDAFIALQDSTLGNVWVYKPAGWQGGVATLSVESPNLAPTVEMLSAADADNLVPGDTAVFTAAASDQDGDVQRVQFYLEDELIGETYTKPYSVSWRPAKPGAYTLTARALDNNGAESVTSATHVVVKRERNRKPVVAFADLADGGRHPFAPLQLAVDASDADGRPERVEYFVNGVQVGRGYSAPWRVEWTPPTPGLYEVTAMAIDNRDAVSEPTTILLTIGEAGSE